MGTWRMKLEALAAAVAFAEAGEWSTATKLVKEYDRMDPKRAAKDNQRPRTKRGRRLRA
jgi:hypothetical protein